MDRLYMETLKKAFHDKTKNQQSEQKQILSQIDVLNTRINNARELVADGKIDADDYKELKQDCSHKINVLEAKLADCSNTHKGIDGLLQKAMDNLCKLDTLYEEGTVAQKRQIIGSIFPENLIFDGFQYRTARLNKAVRLIYTLGEGFGEIKNRKDDEISCLSCEVDYCSRSSNFVFNDLILINSNII